MSTAVLSLATFPTLTLTSAELLHRLVYQRDVVAPRLARLMGYYRNPLSEIISYLPVSRSATLSVRPYRQYQELGLPTRITGFRHSAEGRPIAAGPLDAQRKEVVIENDIAWRVNTLVDFALSRMPVITSTAPDEKLRPVISALLSAVLEASGGVMLLQQLTLLGAVHGSSYLLLEPSPELLQAMARQAHGPAAVLPGDAVDTAGEGWDDEGDEDECGGGEEGENLGRNGEGARASSGAAGVLNGAAVASGAAVRARPDIASKEAPADRSGINPLAWARALRMVAVEAARVLPLACPSPFSSPSSSSPTSSSPSSLSSSHALAGSSLFVSGTDGGGTVAEASASGAAAFPASLALGHAAILHPAAFGPAGEGKTAGSTFRRVTQFITRFLPAGAGNDGECAGLSFDLWSGTHWQRYIGGVLADEGDNPLGFVPLVPFVNQIAPPCGDDPCPLAGLSEVEPLLGLQDELNTRLSDRATRVTLQSFRMYLAKGVEDFTTRPVGPGQMWATDNPEASIEAFGSDGAAPSEDAHIGEVREALDKISGVPPVAAGLLEARIGNLTSAVALKITLIALLSRTDKRRTALEQTLNLLCRRILEVFHAAGILRTTEGDRAISFNWPNAMPEGLVDKLQEAKMKLDLGVSKGTVLRELGYGEEAN